ncbi:hypothetical protein [Georgenia sp. H159]|uniref:prealbumin-like fold domain-containing protein n=1 Tax=Georgenia sp. H159 TaxID=3076115 RepID=UPI002D79F20E|nr:hypothetical protein [Georgenia sp. H159]
MRHRASSGGRRTARFGLAALVSLALVSGTSSGAGGWAADGPGGVPDVTTTASSATAVSDEEAGESAADAPAPTAPAGVAAPGEALAETPAPAPTDEPAVETATSSATDDEPAAGSAPAVAVVGEPTVAAPLSEPAGYCNPQPGSLLGYEHQQANGSWTKGNLGTGYSEGDWIPQRARLSLSAGRNEVVMSYAMNDGPIYGYDGLRAVGVTNGTDVLGADAIIVQETVSGPVSARTVTVTMRFELPTAGDYHLLWDVHVASALDWGAGHGAGSYSGSSLHARIVQLNCAKLGNNTLPAPFKDIAYGTLTVDKVTDPGGSLDEFTFTLSGPGYEGEDAVVLTLSDAASPWTNQLPTETFTISEVDLPPGWELTDLACTGGVTATYSGTSATFTVVDEADVVCTFTNTMDLDELVVTTTATASFARAYDWEVAKAVQGEDRVDAAADQDEARFGYEVVATPTATDSAFAIGGTITVANPNDVPFTDVDVADLVPGATCTVTDGTGRTVPAQGSIELDYACALPDTTPADSTVSMTATATWDAGSHPGTGGTATGTAAVDFGAVAPATTDRSVALSDSHHELPGAPVLLDAEDGARTFAYDLAWPVTAGCVEYTNTARLTNDENVDVSAAATVTVCAQTLTLVKEVAGGTENPARWTLSATADGPSGITGTGRATGRVDAGAPYALQESDGPAEYVQDGPWRCELADGLPLPLAADGAVVVPGGGDVTCTVTNATATVTLLKHVVGDTVLVPADWELTATPVDGPTGLDARTVPGSQGISEGNSFHVRPEQRYTLSETAVAGNPLAYRHLAVQEYVGATPENPDHDAAADWVDVDPSAVTLGTGDRAVYRFVNAPVAALALPLTGGTGPAGYLGVGALWLALAVGAGAAHHVRTRRTT